MLPGLRCFYSAIAVSAITDKELGGSCAATSVRSALGFRLRLSHSFADWHRIDAEGAGEVIMAEAVAGLLLDAADHMPDPI